MKRFRNTSVWGAEMSLYLSRRTQPNPVHGWLCRSGHAYTRAICEEVLSVRCPVAGCTLLNTEDR
jgi:hypothetical protein